MKSIALVVLSALMALSVGANYLKERLASNRLNQNGWPGIKYYRTYRLVWQNYFWNGF
jgi:hypothetical protein